MQTSRTDKGHSWEPLRCCRFGKRRSADSGGRRRSVAHRLRHFRGLRTAAAADVVGRHVRSADGLHAPSRGGLSAHGASLARLAPDRRERPRPARRQRRRSLSSHCKHLPSTHSYLIPHTWFIIYLTSFILSLVFSKYLSWIETPCAYRN